MSERRQDVPLPRGHEFQTLSEAELRQIYDEEEIERSITFFSAYVTEIRLSTGVTSAGSTKSHPVNNLDLTTGRPSLSEYVAYSYLLPHLPPGAGVSPEFTLKRLSLTAQRLYLALFPPYSALLLDLAQLALWKDYQRSLRHCIVFWFLWFHDLLLPALVFRIVFGLLRRRLSSYPTLQELQKRRQDTAQAYRFWEAVQQHISAATLGPIDLWHLFKTYRSERESKPNPELKDAIETDEEENLKRDILRVLNELADLHERAKNVFTWRRPDVSRRYLLFFTFVGFMALVLPAQYIAKLIYGFGGVLFWHVTPVVAALPREDMTRVSIVFRDAPTDADYAMELIATRVAAGHDVGISRRTHSRTSSTSTSADITRPSSFDNSQGDQSFGHDRINWKKWGERIAHGRSFLEEGRQLLSSHTSRNATSGETGESRDHVGVAGEHTFLAQHAASCPGLITLTSSILIFTPFSPAHARLVMPRDRLRGVRKSGLVKGITITWAPEGSIGREEREEKFHWVKSRDELFARLVGSDGGRWLTV